MKPRTGLAAVALLLVGGCTSTVPQSPHRAPSASPATLAGGCGATRLLQGAPPAWNPRPAGFNGPPGLPYVLGRKGTIMGYLFRTPLVAAPRGPGDKILWYVRLPRHGSPLSITGHPRGADHPRVSRRFLADSSPGEIYPSGVDVPRPGCWVFTLTWDGHEDDLTLSFSAATHANPS